MGGVRRGVRGGGVLRLESKCILIIFLSSLLGFAETLVSSSKKSSRTVAAASIRDDQSEAGMR